MRHLIIRHIDTHVDKAIQMDTKLHFIVHLFILDLG
jgi:hypothetical protein